MRGRSGPRFVWAVDWPWLIVLWPVYVLRGLLVVSWWLFVVPFKVLRWCFTGRSRR